MKNKNKINVKTCSFVCASDLFFGIENLLDELSEDGNITWGDANRTLVSMDRVLDALENTDEIVDYEVLRNRCEKFDKTVYVDLEN